MCPSKLWYSSPSLPVAAAFLSASHFLHSTSGFPGSITSQLIQGFICNNIGNGEGGGGGFDFPSPSKKSSPHSTTPLIVELSSSIIEHLDSVPIYVISVALPTAHYSLSTLI